MKTLLKVLSLVLVLVYSQADEEDICAKALGPEELGQVEGHWVMTYLAHDKTIHFEGIPVWTSSHLEINVLNNNCTLVIKELAMFGGKCVTYIYNLTLPEDQDGPHKLQLESGAKVRIEDGEEKEYGDRTATARFLHVSEKNMIFFYKGDTYGSFVLMYRREGRHVDYLDTEHGMHRRIRKCLKMPRDNIEEWHYKLGDFCHKKSVLASLDSDELHQVQGDWDLRWMTYDKTREDPDMVFTSSHIKLDVHNDNHTVNFTEHNIIKEKCVSYTGKLILPQDCERIHRLRMVDMMEHRDGVDKPFNDIATVEFFLSPENFMDIFLKCELHGDILLTYTKTGHQHDKDSMDKKQIEHQAVAKYLGLSGPNFEEWHDDNLQAADICSKKASEES